MMDAFAGLSEIGRVLVRGPTLTSDLLGTAGVQCDVRAIEPESYGAALQYFTGSKDHNVQLRELAVRRGLKVNEYGVFRVEDERKIAGATEAEVYGALELQWIPPEIREAQGEIDLEIGRAH